MSNHLYLVTLSHGMDDIPIQLFEDRDEAFACANAIGWDAPEHLLQRLEFPDCDSPCVITITTFYDGTPVSRVVVRSYEDEEDA